MRKEFSSKADVVEDKDVGVFVHRMLEKLPNLIYARLCCSASSKVSMVPLLKLKHLELSLSACGSLDRMPLGMLFPSLQTALFSCCGSMSILDAEECRHLRRLLLTGVWAYRIVKPSQCRLSVNIQSLILEGLEA